MPILWNAACFSFTGRPAARAMATTSFTRTSMPPPRGLTRNRVAPGPSIVNDYLRYFFRLIDVLFRRPPHWFELSQRSRRAKPTKEKRTQGQLGSQRITSDGSEPP